MAQLGSMPQRLPKPHQKVQFSDAIQAIVNDLDQNSNRNHSIARLGQKYQVTRRRLYDVINVFTAIGCSTRKGTEEITWHDRDHALSELKEASRKKEIHNPDKSITELFPAENCIGLPSLTVSFILLFAAMQVEVIDLREASCFFSRNSVRYKTTICKLYQIAMILGTVRVIQKTQNVCEVRLEAPFTELLTDQPSMRFLAIESLLNRPATNGSAIERRKADYQRYWKKHFRE
jgi:hypothetical protein